MTVNKEGDYIYFNDFCIDWENIFNNMYDLTNLDELGYSPAEMAMMEDLDICQFIIGWDEWGTIYQKLANWNVYEMILRDLNESFEL